MRQASTISHGASTLLGVVLLRTEMLSVPRCVNNCVYCRRICESFQERPSNNYVCLPFARPPGGVALHVLACRVAECAQIMEKKPTVVRGNASEIMALAAICKVEVPDTSQCGAGGKGVDSTNTSEEAEASAIALAKRYRCVVAVSGAVDIITDGSIKVLISNGQEMLTKITAAGCSLSTLCAAYCAVSQRPLEGVVAAFAHFTIASDLAAAMPQVMGPGTLRAHMLDQLYLLTPDALERHMKMQVVSLSS